VLPAATELISNLSICSFSIRQKMSEEAFRNAIVGLDSEAFYAPAKLLEFSVDPAHEYSVLSKVEINGAVTEIRRWVLPTDLQNVRRALTRS
jgi:hypothetical protein